MTCIIIEDQAPAQRILKKYIHDMGSLKLLASFPDAIQALDFLKTNVVDLAFVDIHLPKISGIEFLKALPNSPYIILTTAFPDYALEGYELNVVDYLLKPFSFQRFMKAVSKVPTQNTATSSTDAPDIARKEIFIKSGYEHIKITIADILFIQSDTDYSVIHLLDKKYLSSEPLRHWLETLNAAQFIRIHKSFIVNTTKIEKISGNRVYLRDKDAIPIGRAFKEEFMRRIIR